MAILRTLPGLLLIACTSSFALADDPVGGVEPADTVSADGTQVPIDTGGVIDEGQPGDDSASADDGAVDDPAVDDGYVDNTGDDGSVDDGIVDDGSVDDGAVDDGTIDDGAIDDGATDEDYADDGSTGDDGNIDDGTIDEGNVDDGNVDDDYADDGSIGDDGTVDDGTIDDGSLDDANVDDDYADDGSVDDGTVEDGGIGDDGTVDEEYADDGATDDGNIDDTGTGGETTPEDDYAGGDEVIRVDTGEIVYDGGIKTIDGTVLRDPTAGGIYTVNTMGTLPGDSLPPIMSPMNGSVPPVDVMSGSPMAGGAESAATPAAVTLSPAITLSLPDATGAALYQPIQSESVLGAGEPIVAIGSGTEAAGAASGANGSQPASVRIRAGHLVATPN